jgi:hypothetical protein
MGLGLPKGQADRSLPLYLEATLIGGPQALSRHQAIGTTPPAAAIVIHGDDNRVRAAIDQKDVVATPEG